MTSTPKSPGFVLNPPVMGTYPTGVRPRPFRGGRVGNVQPWRACIATPQKKMQRSKIQSWSWVEYNVKYTVSDFCWGRIHFSSKQLPFRSESELSWPWGFSMTTGNKGHRRRAAFFMLQLPDDQWGQRGSPTIAGKHLWAKWQGQRWQNQHYHLCHFYPAQIYHGEPELNRRYPFLFGELAGQPCVKSCTWTWTPQKDPKLTAVTALIPIKSNYSNM
jgi:hypothetical protein